MPLPPIQPPLGPPPMQTPARIHVARYVRNGLVPHAVFESEIAASLNFTGAVRNKQLFHGACPLDAIPSADAERVRWRFAAHTGPLLRRVWCQVLVAAKDIGDPDDAPTVTLTLTNEDESVTYGEGRFAIGLTPATNDTPNEFAHGTFAIAGVPANTTVYGKFTDSDNGGRLIAATVYEQSLAVTAANGYAVPPQVAVTAPILDARRQRMYELATLLWARGAAHLINWTVDNQASPRTVSDGTPINVVDNAASGSNGPRFRIDTRYCRTLGRATVPCVLAAYGKMSGSSDTGEVWLSGVNGGFLGAVSISGTTAKWWTTTIDLPADLDEYYIEISNPDATETLSVGAVSLFQLA